MDLDSVSVHTQAKKELGQYPAILTSHLVNNPYILWQAYSPGKYVGFNHFDQSFQVSSEFSSLLGIEKIHAQLETCQIMKVYTKDLQDPQQKNSKLNAMKC